MMDGMNEPGTVNGALQSLKEAYQRRYTPERIQEQLNARDQAIQQYTSALGQPAERPGFVSQLTSNYLANYQPGYASAGMARALGKTQGAMAQQGLEDRNRRIQELGGLADLQNRVLKQDDEGLKSLAKGSGGMKPQVKMDKDGNMVVYDPASGETKVVHSSQRGEYQRIWTKAYQSAVDQNMDNPEQYAHGVAANVLGTGQAVSSGEPVPSGSAPSIAYEDKAEKERKKKFAAGTEDMYLKDYEENVKPAAAAADSMLQTTAMIAQVPYEPGAFAEWKAQAGAAMEALGMDGRLVTQAQNAQQLRPLLAKLANDRLMMAKGVQTEGDAQRAYNEFLKITDTKEAADFMLAWTKELANRAKFKDNVYRTAAEQEGTWKSGKDWWNNTDYAKTQAVKLISGKPYTFTDWRDMFLKVNKGAKLSDAVQEWNNIGGGK